MFINKSFKVRILFEWKNVRFSNLQFLSLSCEIEMKSPNYRVGGENNQPLHCGVLILTISIAIVVDIYIQFEIIINIYVYIHQEWPNP